MVASDNNFMVSGSAHAEIWSLLKMFHGLVSRKSRIFVRKYPQAPISVTAPKNKDVFFLSGLFRKTKRALILKRRIDFPLLHKFPRPFPPPQSNHNPVAGNEILAKLGYFIFIFFFFFLRHFIKS